MKKISKNAILQGMDCIVIGGVADGLLLNKVDPTMPAMRLSRPESIKPLASSTQEQPEVEEATDTYIIHPINLINDDGSQALFGLAVHIDTKLSAGFSELVIAYVEKVANRIAEESAPRITH